MSWTRGGRQHCRDAPRRCREAGEHGWWHQPGMADESYEGKNGRLVSPPSCVIPNLPTHTGGSILIAVYAQLETQDDIGTSTWDKVPPWRNKFTHAPQPTAWLSWRRWLLTRGWQMFLIDSDTSLSGRDGLRVAFRPRGLHDLTCLWSIGCCGHRLLDVTHPRFLGL